MDEVVCMARSEIHRFKSRVQDVPYERKGILYSEMFFFYLCSRTVSPLRILESGRARGQSTLLLATCFPQLPVVSIEYDRNSPDAAVAEKRLSRHCNVQLMFGDATRLLPRMATSGDVAIIDGPKRFRAIRLALRLLRQGRMRMVFLHDMGRGSPERRFLEKYLPGTLYSDDPRFASVAHSLDAHAVQDIPPAHQWRMNGAERVYGYSLACLQHCPSTNYTGALGVAVITGLLERLRN